MATIADRRLSIYRALKTIEGWNAYQYLVGAPMMPALMVGAPSDGDLHDDFAGEGHFSFTVYALCGGAGDWSVAQQAIDPLLAPGGAGSICAALDASDIAGQIETITFSDYGPGANWADTPVFMVRIRLEVLS